MRHWYTIEVERWLPGNTRAGGYFAASGTWCRYADADAMNAKQALDHFVATHTDKVASMPDRPVRITAFKGRIGAQDQPVMTIYDELIHST